MELIIGSRMATLNVLHAYCVLSTRLDTGCTDEGNREHALKQRDSVVNKGLGVFDRHRLRYMGTLSTDFSAPELQK